MLKRGDVVGIPCEVRQGPSSKERLISFEAVSGRITGFVSESELRDKGHDSWLVRATVLKLKGDVVEVRVRGSFFNTNGLADIRREMALAA